MKVQVITLFPEMFAALASGIPGRAQKRGLFQLSCLNPRDFSTDHHSVDDKPYGGGPGMVMKFQPLQAAIREARQRSRAFDTVTQPLVIYLSPQGWCFDQAAAQQLSKRTSLILLAGRYEGVDERLIEQEVDEEWSIGNFVLSGGELAAMCMIDAVVRLLDGALGHSESAVQDSFTQSLLDHPHYTRPGIVANQAVPDVLLSGNHDAIARWRLKQSLGRTWQRRPDLLEKHVLSAWERVLLAEFIHEHSEESGGQSE